MQKTHDYEYQYDNEGVIGSCRIRIFEGGDRPIIIATQQRKPQGAHRGSALNAANIIAAHFIEQGPLSRLHLSHELREESVRKQTLEPIVKVAPFVFVEEYLEPEHKLNFLWFNSYEPVSFILGGKEQTHIGYPYRQPTTSEEVEALIGTYDFVCQCDERFRSACKGLPFYAEHEGKPLCVLHYPGFNEKVYAFDDVISKKLETGDLNFRGAWFPEADPFEVGKNFVGLADFSYATFNQSPGEDFELCTLFTENAFSGDVSFHKTKFCTEAIFSGVHFTGNADFSSATFEGPVMFDKEVCFSKLAEFSGANFVEEADFSDARFEGGVRFSKTDFKQDVSFYETVFCADGEDSTLDFSQVVFHQAVEFSEAGFYADKVVFSEGAYAENAKTKFLGEAGFYETSFGGEVSGVDFKGDICFSGIEFCEEADFSEATFHGNAVLGSATFNKEASFQNTKFLGPTYFAKISFFAETNFIDAQFFEGSDTSFDETKFRSLVMFDNAVFDKAFFRGAAFDEADFRKATFDSADFFKSTFAETVDFEECVFEKADFTEAKFLGDTNFVNTTFENEAKFSEVIFTSGSRVRFFGTEANMMFKPETNVSFQGARIHDPEQLTFHTVLLRPSWFVDTDARNLNFINAKWHRLLNNHKEFLQNEISVLQDQNIQSPHSLLAKTCRELYTNYEEKREYPTAGEFHYWSMYALRKEGLWHFGFIRTLYGWMSGYGERPNRAFGALVFIWAAFTMSYWLFGPEALAIPSIPAESVENLWQSAVYSLSALARLRPNPVPEFGLFQLLVTLEGLLGPLQIALFALAVRRKVMR